MTADDARNLARSLYEGRVDRVGLPEFDHLERVALAVPQEYRVVAYLHDVIEDGLMTLAEVKEKCYIPDSVAIFKLTRRPEQTYMGYISNLASSAGTSGPVVRAVKIADIRDNMTRPCPPEMLDMRKPGGRYDRAKRILVDAQMLGVDWSSSA